MNELLERTSNNSTEMVDLLGFSYSHEAFLLADNGSITNNLHW